jgi:hypothetical protein
MAVAIPFAENAFGSARQAAFATTSTASSSDPQLCPEPVAGSPAPDGFGTIAVQPNQVTSGGSESPLLTFTYTPTDRVFPGDILMIDLPPTWPAPSPVPTLAPSPSPSSLPDGVAYVTAENVDGSAPAPTTSVNGSVVSVTVPSTTENMPPAILVLYEATAPSPSPQSVFPACVQLADEPTVASLSGSPMVVLVTAPLVSASASPSNPPSTPPTTGSNSGASGGRSWTPRILIVLVVVLVAIIGAVVARLRVRGRPAPVGVQAIPHPDPTASARVIRHGRRLSIRLVPHLGEIVIGLRKKES